MGQVIVREVAVGGGFGSKSKIADQEVLAGALAVRTGRPVRLVLSRAEEFATTKCRHAFDVELTTGIDGDGRLTHRETRILVDNGAYNHSGASVTGAAVAAAASWYRTGGGVHVRATLVDTNKHPGGQFRGYGHPQVAFAIESQMDELADARGLDPIDFRILNAHRSGDVTRAGWRLHSAHLVECLEAVRDAIGWREKRARAGTGRGVGVAVAMHVSGARTYEHANRAEAGIDVRADGTVRVRFGGADPGTGQKTAIAQVAAEELGVDLSRITVVTMDTEETPFDLGSWSSRGTVMGVHAVGTAARSAARRLRDDRRRQAGRCGRGRVAARRIRRGRQRPRPDRGPGDDARRRARRDRVGRGRHGARELRHRRRRHLAGLRLRRPRGGGGGGPGHRAGPRPRCRRRARLRDRDQPHRGGEPDRRRSRHGARGGARRGAALRGRPPGQPGVSPLRAPARRRRAAGPRDPPRARRSAFAVRREGRRRDQHGAGGAGRRQRGRPRGRRPDPRAADHARQGAGSAPRPRRAAAPLSRVAPPEAVVDRLDALGLPAGRSRPLAPVGHARRRCRPRPPASPRSTGRPR